MKILRASHYGMCFGVRDAITLARREAQRQPITVLGDLVHNEAVLADLATRGVQVERDLDNVQTHTVVITAHGASDRRIEAVRSRGHRVVEATCPLVRFAHGRILELARAGFHPVIVGKHDHVEVRGLVEDLAEYDVVLTEEDVDRIAPRERFGVAAQTTQPETRVARLAQRLRDRFPAAEVRVAETVCLPTRQRQQSAEDVARRSSVVVVIGGSHSNNTRELARTCERFCSRVHQVQTAADLDPSWFRAEDVVGITAGTSTPDIVIEGVIRSLTILDRQLAPTAVEVPA